MTLFTLIVFILFSTTIILVTFSFSAKVPLLGIKEKLISLIICALCVPCLIFRNDIGNPFFNLVMVWIIRGLIFLIFLCICFKNFYILTFIISALCVTEIFQIVFLFENLILYAPLTNNCIIYTFLNGILCFFLLVLKLRYEKIPSTETCCGNCFNGLTEQNDNLTLQVIVQEEMSEDINLIQNYELSEAPPPYNEPQPYVISEATLFSETQQLALNERAKKNEKQFFMEHILKDISPEKAETYYNLFIRNDLDKSTLTNREYKIDQEFLLSINITNGRDRLVIIKNLNSFMSNNTSIA